MNVFACAFETNSSLPRDTLIFGSKTEGTVSNINVAHIRIVNRKYALLIGQQIEIINLEQALILDEEEPDPKW